MSLMARKKKQPDKKKHGKVGSDPEALKEIGGEGDFGIPAGKSGPDRDYVSGNVRASDRGASQPGSQEFTGDRTHGAGGKASGVGSSSGGDLDTDFIGVGTEGSGLAANPPDKHRPGPDDSDGSPGEMGSGPSQGDNPPKDVGKVGGPRPVYRSMAKAHSDNAEPGASDTSANPQQREEDSFRGEVSSGEARGEDQDPDQSTEDT